MYPIWDYIIDGCLLDDPKEAAKVRRGLLGLLITREAYTSEVSSHQSLSASREKTLNTCQGNYTRVYAEIISEIEHWQERF